MRKLNLVKTAKNIDNLIANNNLYSYYALTENHAVDSVDKTYVHAHYRFSCSGDVACPNESVERLRNMLTKMQEHYLHVMGLEQPLFVINKMTAKVAPYFTIVIDIHVKEVKGAFNSIVKYVGPAKHQYHDAGIWVRANEKADVWKPLYDENGAGHTSTDDSTLNGVLDETTAQVWLAKVKEARTIAKDCVYKKGNPTDDDIMSLEEIMYRTNMDELTA